MAVTRPLLDGLRPVPGSLRLVLARWGLALLAAAPVWYMGGGALGDSIANRPYFVNAPDPPPFALLGRLFQAVPGGVWGAMVGGALLAWLAGLLLTGGAVAVLDPQRRGPVRVWRTVIDVGTPAIWAYLRIAFFAAITLFIGLRILSAIFERIGDHGELAGWTADTSIYRVLPLRILITLLWMGLVGSLALWSRVLVVADGRRRVRRLPWLVLRTWWRHPFRGMAFHVALATLSVLTGAAVVAGWSLSGGGALWIALWFLVVLLQAIAWHWRLRACRLLWAGPRLQDLRARPDDGPGWIRRWWRGRQARRRSDATNDDTTRNGGAA